MATFACENVISLNNIQRGFIFSVRSIQYLHRSREELRQTTHNIFSPAAVFSDDLMTLPAAHEQLRNFLESRSVTLRQHRSRQIVFTLVQIFLRPRE